PLMSDRSGETTAARLPRNRSRPYAKNWPIIPPHLRDPIWKLFPLTQISRAARKALLLLSQESKPNLARRRKLQHRQPRPGLNRRSPDCHPERSDAKWRGARHETGKVTSSGSSGPGRSAGVARGERGMARNTMDQGK